MVKVVEVAALNAWITSNQRDEATSPEPGPEPIPPEPDAEPRPVGYTGEFSLVFRDEFDGTSLDKNVWEPNWLAGNDTAVTKPINSKEIACFDPKQVSVRNGVLRIDAIEKSQTASDGKTYRYTSGCVTSQKAKEFTYGIFEFRARMHCGSNKNQPFNWPAVWLNGHHNSWPDAGENDVMENLKSGVKSHYHAKSGSNEIHNGGNELPDNTDYTQFHTFACDWSADKIEFRYDGTVVQTVTGSLVLDKPNYIVINLGISDTEGGPKSIPGNFEVDYVRVWVRR